jgi:hypothetical protein
MDDISVYWDPQLRKWIAEYDDGKFNIKVSNDEIEKAQKSMTRLVKAAKEINGVLK